MSSTPAYVLGHADIEIERLQFQAGVIADVSRRLIRECRIVPGMRVLEIGCGVGDLSMLVAEAVGETGNIVAFDREADAIEVARARARTEGHRQIEFVVCSDEGLPNQPAFDAVIGRYVLHHQTNPVAMVRRAAAAVRSGGIVAFHEPAGHIGGHTVPVIDLYVELERSLTSAFSPALPHRDIGGRLIACFEDAGLPAPRLIWESVAGGPESPLWRLMAMTYRSMLPQITANLGQAPAVIGDPATIADRLISRAKALRAQVVSKPQVCAWSVRL